MMPTKTARFVALFTLAGLASCGGANPYVQNRETLDAGFAQIKSGKLDAANTTLEGLIMATNEDPRMFALQRYYAAYLLSRSKLEASVKAKGDDWLGPTVAANYYRSYARDWESDARASKPKDETGEALLSETLAAISLDDVDAYLDLMWLITSGRAKFLTEVGTLVNEDSRFATVTSAEMRAIELGLTDAGMPWLMLALHKHFHDKNGQEETAYRFGIRARELGKKQPTGFPASYSREIVDWITNHPTHAFKSSSNIAFDPNEDFCVESGEPNIQFKAIRK